jgi:predicted dienelactone hydrolase
MATWIPARACTGKIAGKRGTIMLKKILKGVAGILVLVVVLGLAGYIATGPELPPVDSSSAAWLEPGPYTVATRDLLLVDDSRPTAENRGVPGKPDRSFPSTLWYPSDSQGPYPLVAHSHGIVSNRTELAYLAEALASRGYVVIASDYPLTSGATEGGANADDVVNQPADISFLIDSVIELAGSDKPFAGMIDQSRIGLTGFSLGGLTTYLTSYHPRWRDPRIAAGVAIAGPSAIFAPQFFRTTNIPFLAIAGTSDALIEHRRHAADIPMRVSNASLVTIDGGSHLGFVGMADPMFRFSDNPDTLGCAAVMAVLGDDPNATFLTLGTPEEGVDPQRDLPGICDYGYRETTHPGRQHMITQIAAVSFLESVFNADADEREAAREQLEVALAADFEEASFTH